MVKILKLFVLLVCLPLAAQSQTASLVMDIGRGWVQERDSYPGSFLSLHGKVFFLAQEESSGRAVWVSDGTAAGTELLAVSCSEDCTSDTKILGSNGGGVFWISPSNLLWWSDGTRAGTRALRKEELRVPPLDRGGSFAFAGEILYFHGCLGFQDCGVWRSDGTEAGTRPVVSEIPWTNNTVSGLQAAGSTVFFIAAEESNGTGIWKSDGTEAGTRFVKSLEIYPRRTAATADRFFAVVPLRSGKGEELWTSDGTEAGTRALASFPDDPSSDSSEIPWLKPVGGRVYFIANDVVNGWEIWRTDGTPEGTGRVTSFGFYEPFERGLEPWQLEEIGSRVAFVATNGIDGVQLWTAAPGQPMAALAKVCSGEDPDDCELDEPDRWRLGRVGGKILFRGVDAAHGAEIWATDGTASGTRRLSDLCPGPCSGAASEAFVSGFTAWFFAVNSQYARQHELWKSNGTEAGTRRFVRLEEDLSVGDSLATIGNKALFPAGDDEYGWELRVSDGTPEGTGLVKDIAHDNPDALLLDLATLGNDLFFIACSETSEMSLYRSGGTPETTAAVFENDEPGACGSLGNPVAAAGKVFFRKEGDLWATDGTPGDAVRLFETDEENERFLIAAFAEHQGKLYFPVFDQGTIELWKSDGTPGGTGKVLEIPEIRSISNLASLGSELYFTAVDRSGYALSPWRSDGTPAGTRRLMETGIADHESKEVRFIRFGSHVFFAGSKLWKTNGTSEGTVVVSSPSGSLYDPQITDLTVFGGALYFFATISAGERALWRSDGTPAGTTVVQGFVDGFSNPERGYLAVFQGRLFFAANDGVHGRELWTSDGTAAGTTLVRDVYPGSQGSRPSNLVAAGGKLFFAADDGLYGRELWESDGTAAGTRLRQDLSPGGLSSSPQNLTLTGSHLYFSADDGVTGRELWALPLNGAGGCQPSSTVLCLAGGRFRVEAFWRDFEGRTGSGRAAGLTADTGYFWFFDPDNVEVVVKVLDGRGVNGHHWVFYGALSSVEYSITVTDTETGVSRRYFNPTGRLGSVGHTEAFGPRGAFSRLAAGAEAPPPAVTEGSAKAGPCVESATRLCLNGGRFAVEAAWKDFSGNTGTGKAVRLTADTGYFWFFDDDNVELVLKVLDGRPVNNKFWVFYGALSSVEYTITVTDTVTGKTKTYQNPSGRLASVADTTAF